MSVIRPVPAELIFDQISGSVPPAHSTRMDAAAGVVPSIVARRFERRRRPSPPRRRNHTWRRPNPGI